jgi:SAM-dependent methyltransferase
MDANDTKRRQAESFGAGAAAYARGRPPYPRAAVDWLVPVDARRVADVGAGTGLFTRSLVERGLDVVAVEPSDGMRAQLIAGLPTVTAVAGSAESLPLPDGSVDAVFAAQAWHWVDVERASAEAARVLRPGGTLGLLWNIRDESVPWVAALTAVIEPGPEHDAFTEDPPVGAPFDRTERHDVAWTHAMGRDELLDLVRSRSHFLVRSPEQQAAMLHGVRALLDTHPALAGRDVVEMPYVTRCFRTRLR